MTNYIPFISFVLITTFTPGPNNIMSMINGSKVGIRKALKFNIGVFLGFVIVMILCAAFSAFLFDYLPFIKPFMKYIGASYILWLAYKTYKSEYHITNEYKTQLLGIKEGFALQFVNPKVILYGITTLSTFIMPYYTSNLTIMLFAISLASVALIATLCWSAFGSIFYKLLKKRAKLVNVIMALFLVYTAISLLI